MPRLEDCENESWRLLVREQGSAVVIAERAYPSAAYCARVARRLVNESPLRYVEVEIFDPAGRLYRRASSFNALRWQWGRRVKPNSEGDAECLSATA